MSIVSHPEGPVTVDLFQPFVASCSATGSGIIEFIFTRNGQILTNNANTNITIMEEVGLMPVVVATLNVHNVTVEDVGEYSCIASNEMSSDNATFTVEFTLNPGK